MVLTSPPPEPSPGIEVRRVDTFADYTAARDVQWEAFEVTEARREVQRPHLRNEFEESLEHGTPVTFLGLVNGRPAATGTAIASDRGVFLIAGSTAPWARG